MKIEELIKQDRFKNDLLKLIINLKFTCNALEYKEFVILKEFGLSSQQFNILRIIRGQNGKAVPLKLITERMIDRMSNTSRLVDKLVVKGLLIKETNKKSKRQVDIMITKKGLTVIDEASKAIENFVESNNPFTKEELSQFNNLLERFRSSHTDY